MLTEGKKVLTQKGIETDIFMAPAHSYDKKTLKALKETGFNILTDGFGDLPYEWKEMKFYPISFQLSRVFKKKMVIPLWWFIRIRFLMRIWSGMKVIS